MITTTGAQKKMESIATAMLELEITAIAHLKDINALASQMTGTQQDKLETFAMTIMDMTALVHTLMGSPIGAWINLASSGI